VKSIALAVLSAALLALPSIVFAQGVPISGLPAVIGTPATGDVLPIVDGGTTKKVTITQLAAAIYAASTTINGTTNQILTSGCTPIVISVPCVLSLPQSINSGAAPTFLATNFTGIPAGAFLAGALTSQIGFDVSNVGASNANTAIVQRYGLPLSVRVVAVSAVCTASTSSSFNVTLGEVSETGTVPSGSSTATAGQSLFVSDQALPAAGTVTVYTPDASVTAIWPAGSELTERIVTPGGNGAAGCVLTLWTNQ